MRFLPRDEEAMTARRWPGTKHPGPNETVAARPARVVGRRLARPASRARRWPRWPPIQAREVAGLVREQATQLTQDLSEQGRILYEETRQQVAEQADVQTQVLTQTLHRWGAESQALVEGRPADAGTVGVCVRQCADRLYQAASEIEIRGAADCSRRPSTSLAGAPVPSSSGPPSSASGGGGCFAAPRWIRTTGARTARWPLEERSTTTQAEPVPERRERARV
jgi:hypothetical protein